MGLSWNVWITVLAPSYEKVITSEMVNLGWTVAPMGGSTINAAPDSKNTGILLAYTINDIKGFHALDINNKVTEILNKNNMKYFSIIISESTAYCCWLGSNISYDSPKESKTKILN